MQSMPLQVQLHSVAILPALVNATGRGVKVNCTGA